MEFLPQVKIPEQKPFRGFCYGKDAAAYCR
jgi:hypothetical protein